MNARTRLFALALLLSAGCHRSQPSPVYAQARADFSHLYAQELDDAYVDPAMDDIEAALRTVPKDSLDAANADTLLQRIADGRAQVEAQRAKTQKAVEEALAPPVMTGSFESTPVAPALKAEADAGVDGGTADGGEEAAIPSTGMSLAEFQKQFGECFHSVGEARMKKDGPPVTLYGVSAGTTCQTKFKSFEGRLVVTDQSQVLGTTLASAYHPGSARPADAGSAKQPGALPAKP